MTDVNKDLRALLAKATPGEWCITENEGSVGAFADDGKMICDMGCTQWRYEDEALALAAVNALPDLLRVVEAVAADDCIVWGHGEESSNLTERTCGLCGESHPVGTEFVHADDCAWVLARKLTGGAT